MAQRRLKEQGNRLRILSALFSFFVIRKSSNLEDCLDYVIKNKGLGYKLCLPFPKFVHLSVLRNMSNFAWAVANVEICRCDTLWVIAVATEGPRMTGKSIKSLSVI